MTRHKQITRGRLEEAREWFRELADRRPAWLEVKRLRRPSLPKVELRAAIAILTTAALFAVALVALTFLPAEAPASAGGPDPFVTRPGASAPGTRAPDPGTPSGSRPTSATPGPKETVQIVTEVVPAPVAQKPTPGSTRQERSPVSSPGSAPAASPTRSPAPVPPSPVPSKPVVAVPPPGDVVDEVVEQVCRVLKNGKEKCKPVKDKHDPAGTEITAS